MNTLYVYILRCSDKSYYTGITNDLDRRLIEHQQGYNTECYTYVRRPLELVFCQPCYSALEAIQLEKKIKGWSRAKKEALIAQNWDNLKVLSACRNQSHHGNFRT